MTSRRTQPYRTKTPRPPGPTLLAMLKGAPAHAPNPQEARRKLLKRAAVARSIRRRRNTRA